jgi:histidinol dehydrogenase
MKWFNAASPEAESAILTLERRRSAAYAEALTVADEMIAGVRAGGDSFVARQIARFDGKVIDPDQIAVRPGHAAIDAELARALDLAIARTTDFHRAQIPLSYQWESIAHRVRPLRRVGVYVPGGRAVYVSTLIMCAVPARIAGVEEIVVATPPAVAARPELHYVCNLLGIEQIYRSGGAQSIAALALGTRTLPRVDKIVGPGNSYVTAAKARLSGQVGIDMLAGPTELVVIADETASRDFVQADLDAQQEHGSDSAVICICVGRPLDVRSTLTLVTETVAEAIAVADRIAPEHLSIHAREAAAIAERVNNAGAIYCGPYAPPAVGDYVAGSNHVLPTAGSARFTSPLGVYDFVKRTNVVTFSEEALAELAPAAARIARFEGLAAHAASIERPGAVGVER